MTAVSPNYVYGENVEPRRFLYLDTAADHQVKKAVLGNIPIGVSHEGSVDAPIPEVTTHYAGKTGMSRRVYGIGETCEIDVSATLAIVRGDYLCPDANSEAQPAVHGFPYGAIAQASAAAAGKVRALILPPAVMDRSGTVLPKTADYTVLLADLGKVLTNTGATGAVVFSLPAAVVGYEVFARVDAAQELRLDPDGTEQICLPSTGVPGAAGKYLVADALNETVHLKCREAGIWDCLSYTGTWTAEA
jgi:hypothetical protein